MTMKPLLSHDIKVYIALLPSMPVLHKCMYQKRHRSHMTTLRAEKVILRCTFVLPFKICNPALKGDAYLGNLTVFLQCSLHVHKICR